MSSPFIAKLLAIAPLAPPAKKLAALAGAITSRPDCNAAAPYLAQVLSTPSCSCLDTFSPKWDIKLGITAPVSLSARPSGPIVAAPAAIAPSTGADSIARSPAQSRKPFPSSEPNSISRISAGAVLWYWLASCSLAADASLKYWPAPSNPMSVAMEPRPF